MSNIIDSIQLSGVTYTISGQSSGGSPTVELTQAEYDALVSAGTVQEDTYYIITDSSIDYINSAQCQSQIDTSISGKADASAVTEAIDAAVSGKVSTSDFNAYSGATDTLINSKASQSDLNSLSGTVTAHTANANIHLTSAEKTNIDSLATNIAAISGITATKVGNWDTAYTNNHTHSNKSALDAITGNVGTMAYENVSSYSSATEVNSALGNKLDISEFNAYSGSVNTTINSKASQTDLNTLSGTVTAHTANTNIHLTSAEKANLDSLTGAVGTMAYQDTDNYYAKNETSGKTEIATALSGKQDTLSAGTNITIVDNVISAEGGGGKAVSGGTNISVTTGETADTINCTLPIYFNSNEIKGDIAIGTNLTGASSYYHNLLIGRRIEIGNESTSNYNIGIGFNTNSNTSTTYRNTIYGYHNIGIGPNFKIGTSSNVRNNFCVVIGSNSISEIDNGVAIGYKANVSGTTKTNINNQLTIDTSNQVYIYNKDNTEMICLQDQLGGGGIDSGTVQTMIDQSISGKTNQTDFVSHSGNTSIHVTAQDKTNWNNKSDFSGSYNDLTDKPTIPIVPTNVSAFNNDAGYITSNDISGKTNQSDFVSHSGNTTMHVTASEKSTWNNKSDFSGNYNDLSNKPTIPTSASQLTNDSGYITSSALDGYATEAYVTAATNDMATKTWVGQQGYLTQHQDISGKQDVSGMTAYTTTATTNTLSGTVTAHTADTTIHVTSAEKATWNAKSDFSGDYNDLSNKLSAGTNITIVDNVISAEGGGSITIDPSLDSGSTNAVANSAITTALNAKSDKGNFNDFIFTSMNGNTGAKFKKDNGGSKTLWLSKINGTKVFEISDIYQATNFSLVETSAITTAISSSSTDAQVPSAKAVYDIVGNIETLLSQI